MRAILRKWPKRQGRMILQAMYGDEPREARRIVPPNVTAGWNHAAAPEPVYPEVEESSLPLVGASAETASHA